MLVSTVFTRPRFHKRLSYRTVMLGAGKDLADSSFILQVRRLEQRKGKSFTQIFMMILSFKKTEVSKGREREEWIGSKQRFFPLSRVQGLLNEVHFLTPRALSNVCIFRECPVLPVCPDFGGCPDMPASRMCEQDACLTLPLAPQAASPESLPQGYCPG